MKSPACIRSFAIICGLAAFSATTARPASAGTISDPLDLTIAGRHSGQPLDKSLAPDGKTRWSATPNLAFRASGAGSGQLDATTPRGYLAKLALPDGPRRVKVSARLSPVASGDENNWAAIGIGNPGSDNRDITWQGGLFLLVHADGQFSIVAYAASGKPESVRIRIHGGMSPGYRKGEPVAAALQYDNAKGSVSAWINGQEVVDDYDLKAKGGLPALSYAGFSGYSQRDEAPPVSGFAVETQP